MNESTTQSAPDSRAPTRPLWADRRLWWLLALAAGLRLVLGLALWRADPLARVLISDAEYYDRWARALAGGEPFLEGRPYWLPPLYPWALGLLARLTGGALGAVLFVQALAGLAATALLVSFGERVIDRRAGLAGGWLWTFYAPVPFFETRLLAVNAAVPLALVVLHLALSADAALGRRARSAAPRAAAWWSAAAWSAATGLALGLASLARPNLLIAAAFLGAAWLLTHRRRGAYLPAAATVVAVGALLVGFAMGLAPSLAHNRSTSGPSTLVTANGGVNFWFGNNPAAHGTFHAPGPEWGAIDAQRDVSIALASEALGRAVQEPEAGAWWFAEGRAWLFEQPAAAARLWALKLADSFSSTEFGIQYFLAAVRESVPLLWLCPLPFGLLAALAVLGWSGPARGRNTIVAWLLAGLAASLLYFTYSRFRLPLLVAAMPFAGRGALQLAGWARGRERPRAGALALAALVLAQSFVAFEKDYPLQLVSNAHVTAAAAWTTLGEPARAEDELRRALDVLPGNAKALVELARADLARGNWSAAAERLEAAAALGLDYPAIGEARRRLWLTAPPPHGDLPRAVGELRARLANADLSDPQRAREAVLLAGALAEHPSLARDPGEARELALEVLADNPTDAGALGVLRYLGATQSTSQPR